MVLGRFLDPRNDFAFKRVFGNERNKDILIHFINDMVVFNSKQPVVEISFLKTSQDPETASQKQSILDVLCTDQNGQIYIVEMQVAKEPGFEKRAQYYAAKAYCSQVNKGERYENLKEVVFLAIADYTLFPDKKKYKSDHIILDKESCEHNLKDFSFTFLELEKFDKPLSQLDNMVDKWAYFFKHADHTSPEELEFFLKDGSIIKRAYEELDQFSWTKEEIMLYDAEKKRLLDNREAERLRIEEAEARGEARGQARGEEKGIRKVALSLLSQGLDFSVIQQSTGLTKDELILLRTQL